MTALAPLTTSPAPTAVLPSDAPAVDRLVDALRPVLTGSVHVPGDDAYDALVTPWNVAVPMAPAAVVAARTADDVVATVRLAGALRLTVGVQATGHGAHPSLTGDVLVATRHLDEVTLHADEGWVRVGAGVKWAAVLAAAAPHGLMPLMGSSSDVGVVGFLTGGGVGPMARSYGLSADRVRAFDVVTGRGELLRVTPTEHADLFLALRGGKGAVGIVTAVEVDLLPVRTFLGGALYFDGADVAAVLDRWRRWSARLPEEATTSVVLLQLPEAPFVPPPLAGRLTVGVRFVWTGDAPLGSACLAWMRAAAPVLIDDVAVKPVTALDSVHADPVDPMPARESSLLLRELTAEAVDALLAVAGPGTGSPQLAVEIRRLGGALARPGEHPSAFAHRAVEFSLLTVGLAFDPSVAGHGAELAAAVAPWSTGGVWPTMLPVVDAGTAARAYDAGTLARLAAAAAAHDPAGVLAAGGYLRTADGCA